jgi:predicted nucleic acid-binding protein
MKSARSIVIDTSAIIRLFIPDGPLPEEIIESLESAERGEVDLVSPELMSAEFYQVILKKENKSFINAQEANEILENFRHLPITYLSHDPFLSGAGDIARKFNTTIYDGLFLSVAERTKSRLISADDLMLRIFEGLS